MKIYEVIEYGVESYVSSFDKLTEKQKLNLNSDNFAHCTKEIELNEENICLILNKILKDINYCKNNGNSYCF